MPERSFKRWLQQWTYHQRGLRKRTAMIGKSMDEVKAVIDRPKRKK